MNSIFTEAAEPFTFFSYADFAILIFINLVIFLFIKIGRFKLNTLLRILFIISFLIVIPYISIKIEINNVYKTYAVVDGFNLWYTIFKIPIWWIIGIIEYIIITKSIKNYS
ncbi:hypothetical protein SAMN05660477_03022 [Soonwooa buanensis]|uniref:Uncharacterized protein n=1 Tax=Soonwooa buanensis TaxID=619805 RepID=A0A1T5GP67_9FLAO|nr:hypothetical protein [Soonwooa buanensis]SKC10187.1 hypothetical protein SAMN05660477_03022 [Soonwooa buanensis]